MAWLGHQVEVLLKPSANSFQKPGCGSWLKSGELAEKCPKNTLQMDSDFSDVVIPIMSTSGR